MSYKLSALLFCLLLLSEVSFSQFSKNENKKPAVINNSQADNQNEKNSEGLFDKHKLLLGGNMGMALGNPTYIAIAPIVGYQFSNKLSAGTGFNYTYYKEHYINPYSGASDVFSTSQYGTSLWGRYSVYRNLFATSSAEILNKKLPVFDSNTNQYNIKRMNIPSWLVGVGYMQALGRNAGFRLELLYDLIQNPYSTYYRQIPVINGGLVFGI